MDDTARTSRVPQAARQGPLVVDLDGSLIRTDTTVENLLAAVKRPLLLLRALFAWRHGRARLKQELAAAVAFDPAALPYNDALLAYLREQHAAGRVLVLATGADRSTAEAVARHLGLFDLVLASDGEVNLTGRAKLAAIRDHVGDAPFTYVGNSRADLRVWDKAAGAICVDVRRRVARAAAQATTIERSFVSSEGRTRTLVRALRPHQWAKNLLVFVPLVAARAIGDLPGWGAAGLIFLAFCLTASGIYLFNDLCDLSADRRHPSKSRRPFASGALPVQWALVAAPLLLLLGLALGAVAGALSLLLIYAVCSLAYSLWLKSQPPVDVFVLAALYLVRLLAGGEATGYHVSMWLLAFSSFLFLGLAIVKRVAELRSLPAGRESRAAGCGYGADDLPIMQLMGVASSFVASLVLALYVQTELGSPVSRQPTLAWALVPLVLFWQCRMWLATSRGAMNDDPIVFAARDWVSWVVAACAFGVLLLGPPPRI